MGEPRRFAHLRALTDQHGIFEHALRDVPRREHGYCTDDVSRALIVVVRETDHSRSLAELAEVYLRFLEGAVAPSGLVRNRMDVRGDWTDEPAMGDWWGRALWALGTAAHGAADPDVRERALRAFRRAAPHRSRDLRPLAFAALGAAEVVRTHADDAGARAILRDLILAVADEPEAAWPWPEDRLAYGNAAIPDALIAAAFAAEDSVAMDRGLRMLEFLLAVESGPDRLSVTGVGGRDPGERGPMFDQQPIEVSSLADACARAFDQTGDVAWLAGVEMAWRWFTGRNDGSMPMVDDSGAGFDGLREGGRNENRGAESTLAALSTYQQAARLGQLAHA